MKTEIKEKVLKEIKPNVIPYGKFSLNDVKQAIDLTLAEVGKVIDRMPKTKFLGRFNKFIPVRELKQKLGIK